MVPRVPQIQLRAQALVVREGSGLPPIPDIELSSCLLSVVPETEGILPLLNLTNYCFIVSEVISCCSSHLVYWLCEC